MDKREITRFEIYIAEKRIIIHQFYGIVFDLVAFYISLGWKIKMYMQVFIIL